MHTKHPLAARLVLAAATSALILGAAACGDDDDDAASTTNAPSATTAPAADAAGFCDAFVTAVGATMSEDEAAIGPAFEAAVVAAPADIKSAVETVTTTEEGEPAFVEAYGELIGFIKGNCEFTELNVTTKEYSFEGLPQEVPAGKAVITMDNQGEEFHEVLLLKVNDGVTDTALDLISLPEEELMAKASMASATFGAPGEASYGVTELAPGRYIAVCYLPQGATPEVMAQMDGPDSSLPEGAGPPHFMAGMVQEFNVA